MIGAEAVILARCVNSSPDQIDAVRRSILRALPGPQQRSAIAELDRMIAAIDEVGG
jgi:hypothetical protein